MLPGLHSQRNTAVLRKERTLKSRLGIVKLSAPSCTVWLPSSARSIVVPSDP